MKKIIIGVVLLVSVGLSLNHYKTTHTPMYKCMHSEQAAAFRTNPVAEQFAFIMSITVEQLLERTCQEVIATQPGAF